MIKKTDEERAKDLNNLYTEISDSCKVPIVSGKGSLSPSLMILGLEPTKEDEENRTPFSGDYGKIITKMLSLMRVYPEELFLTFYKKTKLVIPIEGKEVNWQKYLIKEIKIVDPSLILVLGKETFQKLIPIEDEINNLRMKAYPFENTFLVVTYPFEIFTKDIAKEREVFEDMIYVRKIVRFASKMKEKDYLKKIN